MALVIHCKSMSLNVGDRPGRHDVTALMRVRADG